MILKDEEIVKRAFDILGKEMKLVEYTRFLQLIGASAGDLTKELREKRDKREIEEAYDLFLKRLGKES